MDTDWDLGIDAMAVWFSQSTRSGEVRLIDYHEDIGGGLIAAIRAVRGQQNPGNDERIDQENTRRCRYVYGKHWPPHDIEVRSIATGKTYRQTAWEHGLRFEVTPKLGLEEGIEAVMQFLSRCYFDEQNCAYGLDCLLRYHRTWQQRLGVFSSTPVKDGSDHCADAFRGLAVRYQAPRLQKPKKNRFDVPITPYS